MNKKLAIIGVSTLLLTACSNTVNYKGKEYSQEQAEDLIEADLAKENPGQDIDVTLQLGNTDKKKKKKVHK